ncbi:MAG TPA: hypothetical protein QGH10_19790 [Armatimonadota bacterium]|nr:hypothetical protein [Armatimonadota bacterium]
MPEAMTLSDIRRDLAAAEDQAAELWRQAEQIRDAYQAIRLRIDEMRAELAAREGLTRTKRGCGRHG